MQRVDDRPIRPGPLAPRWLAYDLGRPRAGVRGSASVELVNAGTATWRSRGREGVQLAYHWLDPLGNPIVWDGIRTPLPRPVAPGESVTLRAPVLAPRPPGRYRLAFDLVEEHRFWFAEVGCATLDVPVQVQPLIDRRLLAAIVHGGPDPEVDAALAAQEEPLAAPVEAVAVAHLAPGAVPPPDWSHRLLDAHAEGYAAVGGALAPEERRQRRALSAWAPGGGRNPSFARPLLLPSLLAGLEPSLHEGLPAWQGEDGLFDGRIVVRLRPRSGRPRG